MLLLDILISYKSSCMQYQENISSTSLRNSEVFASEFLENLEEIFLG